VRALRYLVRISRDSGSDWGASVPDLPGCVATDKTLDATMRRIEAAIALHLAGLRADGIEPREPKPTVISPRKTARHVDFYATVEISAGTQRPRLPVRPSSTAHVRETAMPRRRRPLTPA
jgi:predicted RNase H-like HicB family nuclease